MATCKLIVKSKQKSQPATVYLRFRHGRDIDYVIPTELKVFPEFWNNKSQTFKQRINYTDHFTEKDKNALVVSFQDLTQFVMSENNQRVIRGEPLTKNWLKSIIRKFHSKQETDEGDRITLNQYIQMFIGQCETGERLYNHNNRTERYKPLTIKNFKGFQTQFELFQEEKRREYNYEDITLDFYDDFVLFFTRKSYSPNTIGRNIKNLKTIMRSARDEGLHNNFEIERRKFKTIKADVQNIYLTESEISRMYNLDLSAHPNLEIARDVFLAGCFTAQRFSDYSRIRKEHIRTIEKNTVVIDIVQQKTGERVIIPIKPELHSILLKYDYNLPKIYEQKLNKWIKKVGGMADIYEPVLIEEIRGGLRVSKKVPKNELIKTHTARRSACTNLYLAGIPSIDIMKISGHKSEKEFLGYIKVTKEETAQNLSLHPYFMNKPFKTN